MTRSDALALSREQVRAESLGKHSASAVATPPPGFGGQSRRHFLRLSARGVALLGCGMALPPKQKTVSAATQGFSLTSTPWCAEVSAVEHLVRASASGALQVEARTSAGLRVLLPAQVEGQPASGRLRVTWLLPPDAQTGVPRFRIGSPARAGMRAGLRAGQYELIEGDAAVLRYNYAAVDHPELRPQITESNRKYAVPRSNYIHPLYGLNGEELTRDWPIDHPHHRGIYWAWPEVEWRGQLGDLHALQKVFARPTGRCTCTSGSVFAQVEAENLWHWEDGTAVVRESAMIRAYRRTDAGRILDLAFRFEALNDLVTLARRQRTLYGGLNLRFNAIAHQAIMKHTATEGDTRPVWGQLSGTFPGGRAPSTVMILQHQGNPDYPGDWIDYPDLNWLQPTFPRKEARFELRSGAPLILRYRLVLHPGTALDPTQASTLWRAANAPQSPLRHPLFATAQA